MLPGGTGTLPAESVSTHHNVPLARVADAVIRQLAMLLAVSGVTVVRRACRIVVGPRAGATAVVLATLATIATKAIAGIIAGLAIAIAGMRGGASPPASARMTRIGTVRASVARCEWAP